METWREYVSRDTKIMIDLIVKKSDHLRTLRMQYRTYSRAFLITALLVIVYGALFFLYANEDNPLLTLSAFVSNVIHLVVIALAGGLFFKQQSIDSKIDKAKKKIETLRLELIDHLKNPWYFDEHSDIRDQISVYLEKKGIDVRYKG